MPGLSESYLLTGGAGFLGAHVVKALLDRGHAVRVLDNLSAGHSEDLAPFMSRIDFRRGDITRAGDVRSALEGIDIVVHLAAVRTAKSWENPLLTYEVNAAATLSLLSLARETKVRRIVYASTAAVYGDSPVCPQCEGQVVRPVSPYATSKQAAENYCRLYGSTTGPETVSLRYFNVFGPGQNPVSKYSGVITAFISSLLRNQPCPIYGDGLQSRDFIYIDDAVDATLAACSLPGISGEVLNVGSGRCHTILELAGKLGSLLGKNLPPVHLQKRPADITRTQADIRRLTTVLGIKLRISFDHGLEKTVAWHLQNLSAAARGTRET